MALTQPLTSMGDSSLGVHSASECLGTLGSDLQTSAPTERTLPQVTEHLFTVVWGLCIAAISFPRATLLVEQLWDTGQNSPLFIYIGSR